MSTQNILIGLAILVLIGLGIFAYTQMPTQNPNGDGVLCTQDVQLCPDGTYVARSGPKCEFAECPTTVPPPAPTPGLKSVISGRVTLSPTCPVETVPPSPGCAPKGYQTTVEARATVGNSTIVATTQSDANGYFNLLLDPGTYSVSGAGGGVSSLLAAGGLGGSREDSHYRGVVRQRYSLKNR